MRPKRIAVITPVAPGYDRLQETIESVAAQTLRPALHVVVHDGYEPAERDPRVNHVILTLPCRDTGATPRAVGANIALAQRCDSLAFLDADNTWSPEHLELLANVARKFDIAIARRRICDSNGDPMFDDIRESDGTEFADTNCFLLTGRAVQVARLWGNVPHHPNHATAGVDRILWKRIRRRKFSVGCSDQVTVNYRSRWLGHYKNFPERKPARCKVLRLVKGIPTVRWE